MEENTAREFLALAANSGLVLAFVQLLKTKIIPKLRASAPWAIPLISMGAGMAASYVLTSTGIDISPIAGAFSGFAASGMFAVMKEGTN